MIHQARGRGHARIVIPAVVALLGAGAAAAPDRAKLNVVRVDHRDPAAAPTRGPVDAHVTVELFFIPISGRTQQQLATLRSLDALQARHPTRVRVIWRVLRQGILSTAALEAHAQGKFFQFLERLNSEKTSLTKDKVFELARAIGVDAERVSMAIQQDRYAGTFADNERRAKRMHVQNNPNLLFNSQPPRQAFNNMGIADMERIYTEAFDRAVELVEQGIPPSQLSAAFDAKVLASVSPTVVIGGLPEDDGENPDQQLASPPLAVTGLPAVGADDSPFPVIFLCSPGTTACQRLIEKTLVLQKDVYPDLRVVWAPWFDVGREDAAELAMLGDAALCAETLGSGAPPKSGGWLWVETMYRQLASSRRGQVSADKRIEAIAKALDVDTRRLSACRARIAGTTLDWIAAARQAGVRTSPSVVIGGRIYAGLGDATALQQLVEAELAPGISDAIHEHLGHWPK